MANGMHKEVIYDVLLKLKAGKATPAPPIGTILGPSGININKFCEDFNEWSKNNEGIIETGVIIYSDSNYDILTKEQYLSYKQNEFSRTFSWMYHNYEDKQSKYYIIKELLDKNVDIKEISKLTGISEKEIEKFYNEEYKYIKTDERMQKLNEHFQGESVVRSSIYDSADKPKKR